MYGVLYIHMNSVSETHLVQYQLQNMKSWIAQRKQLLPILSFEFSSFHSLTAYDFFTFMRIVAHVSQHLIISGGSNIDP